jgi:hypothetical protein
MNQPRIVVCGVSPSLKGLQWESDRRLRIGRLDTLEIVLKDRLIGHRHAEIDLTAEGWVVHNLVGPEAVSLNGVSVGQRPLKVSLHDLLKVGDLCLQVKALEEESLASLPIGHSFIRVQGSAERSWQRALDSLDVYKDPPHQQDHPLLALIRASYHLRHVQCLDKLMQSILDDTVAALHAQRGCILMTDAPAKQLQVRAMSPFGDSKTTHGFFSKTLVRRSFDRGESVPPLLKLEESFVRVSIT